MARILAEQPATHPAGANIDDEHGDDDHQQDRADVGIVEFPDCDDELLADAAGADKTHHRGAAHVDLKPQQRVARKARRYLRNDREPHARDPARPGRTHPFDRLHVDVLDDLGV
jgi:hypothetical protein